MILKKMVWIKSNFYPTIWKILVSRQHKQSIEAEYNVEFHIRYLAVGL